MPKIKLKSGKEANTLKPLYAENVQEHKLMQR